MWELDCEEGWASKSWCFWTVVLEKTLESPLDCKEIQPVHPKWDQSWVFIGRNDAKAEIAILWPCCEELTHWKRPWCSERLKVVGEGDNRGWDGWITSLTRWVWVWVSSRSWWWTECAAVHGVAKSQTWLSDWFDLNYPWIGNVFFFCLKGCYHPFVLTKQINSLENMLAYFLAFPFSRASFQPRDWTQLIVQ